MHSLSRPQNMYNTFTMNKSLTPHHHHSHQQNSQIHSTAAAAAAYTCHHYNPSSCFFTQTARTNNLMKESVNADPMRDAATAGVVVNSILYEKASSSRIVVDIGTQITQALLMSNSNHQPRKSANLQHNKHQSKDRACMSDLEKLLSCEQQNKDAEWYVMSTTINGSIQHHISGFCANLLDMILKETRDSEMDSDEEDEDDEDSLVQFVSDDQQIFNNDIVTLNYVDADDNEDEDSFIQFLSDDDNDCDILKKSVLRNDDSDLETDIEEEEEEEDGVDNITESFIESANNFETSRNHSSSLEYNNANSRDSVDGEICFRSTSYRLKQQQGQIPKCDKRKKVSFNIHPVVHVMHTWNYAYRAARIGHWEMYARDRARFKLRVQRTANILEPILQTEHRQKIYETRFHKQQYQSELSSSPILKPQQKNTKKLKAKQCEKHLITKLALIKCKRHHRGRLRKTVRLFYFYIF